MERDRIISTERGPAKTPCFLTQVTIIARVWAMVTVTVMWAAAITTIQRPPDQKQLIIGWYLVREGCCCKCWIIVMWVDDWKKGVLYLVLAIPVFLEGFRFILGILSGFMLVVCGLLYIVKTFRDGLVYTVTETRYVKTFTPSVRVVTHNIETQTEDYKYYQELYDTHRH
ncbi:hypothetical protein FSP39_019324 [Pinctada imbricata]|uniref:Uncharacterized protein n=1 Tax=Pinctada imbricata TaxID=66713 RepID=A0AA88Y425_PINIB|nr:hypothetical protein FSP39_019324 [Pinctada imbricata]